MTHVITITHRKGTTVVAWSCSCGATGEEDQARVPFGRAGAKHVRPGQAVRWRPRARP